MHNRGNSTERSKDFVGSIKRLLKELKSFKIFIFVALILATTGSILSIIAPNQLSKLTDTISQGLVVKSENIKKITETTTKNLSNLDPKIIMTSSRLSAQEKSQFMTIIKDIDKNDQIFYPNPFYHYKLLLLINQNMFLQYGNLIYPILLVVVQNIFVIFQE